MKKTALLIILILGLTGLGSAQTANETINQLQQAQEEIKLMEEENIPVERVQNLLESANNSYLAQKNFAEEGGKADYSRAIELTQQISEIQERSITASDRINALESRLKELNSTSVNLTNAQNQLKAAKDDFQSQRFEEASQHIETGYSEISEAQSARTQVESFAAAQREDITSRINSLIQYFRENTFKVAGGSIMATLVLTFLTKEFRTYRLITKRKKREIKKNVVTDLITDIQEEYYMRKEGSPIQFNTKLSKFEKMHRDAVEDIEVIDRKLKNRKSLIWQPEEASK